MLRQISTLTKLELTNIFGVNVLRNTKAPNEKKKKTALAVIIVLLILMAAFYTGSLAYGLIYIGMEDIVFAYLSFLASVIILFFGFFKAGAYIFSRNGYDIISSLPVSKTAIVVSRYMRMYVENLMVSAIVMLPGMIVYGVMSKPQFLSCIYGFFGMLCIPLIPMSAATFVGGLITGISSRMRHKSVVESVITIAFVIVVFAFSGSMGNMDSELNAERIQELSGVLEGVLGKMYPPALWLGAAVFNADFSKWFLYFCVSAASMAVCTVIVAARFEVICRNLFGTVAKHNYEMQGQKAAGLGRALVEREIRRYFSSGIYVTNTIMGPVMGTAASIAVFAVGISAVTEKLALPIALDVDSALPMAVGAIFCMMSMSCVSVSMEGKNWWIVKSLPLAPRDILNAKAMANFVILLPFYLVSEIFLMLAIKPSFLEALWMLLAPALCCVFSVVFGIAANLALPLMNWDKEVSVVKQSASGLAGGLGGALICLILTGVVAVVPGKYSLLCKLGSIVVLLTASVALYERNGRKNLQEIG